MANALTPLALVLLVILVVGLTAFALTVSAAKRALEKTALEEKAAHEREVTRTRATAQAAAQAAAALELSLRSDIAYLERWRGVADADAKAAEIAKDAMEFMEQATAEAAARRESSRLAAESDLAAARQEGARILSAARGEANESRAKAALTLDSSTKQAATIIENATKRAEEIAGDAYTAMKDAALYEKAARAMKNIIEGYGTAYVIPAHSLLDALAIEVGYSEAGDQLAKARERSRLMVRNGTAATCEYVEDNRRTTAIAFVLDAFNGKTDSILSRVKSDNVGTLTQEVRDAFSVVNLNGRAFRNARITDEYLSARLEELKWATVAQQIRLDEREEQRRIKEQIREEEKARREYERAMKEAAKEEDLLRKAMEKAQEKIRDATDEQRARYELQLAELSERLSAAEERNQRALSMAQQTRRGHVYVISNVGSFGENVYKIGLTRRLEPLDRIRELGDSSVPFEFDVHALIFSEDAPALEGRLHKHFVLMQMNKVNHRKEFFRVDLPHIRAELDTLGLQAAWTMTAQAREYYETLAIERVIAGDPAKRDAWVARQLELESIDVRIAESEPEAVAQ